MRDRRSWSYVTAALIACGGAGLLLYFWRAAPPLWVDEEMLALNARDRPLSALGGSPWMGQAAPLGWLALERASMLLLGLSERAVRALPVAWGLATLATALWVGCRWLGPIGAAAFAMLCALGSHVWHFALELKQYSADTFGGLFVPAMAAWATEPPRDSVGRFNGRAAAWWVVAGILQWFSYGALFVAPACGVLMVAVIWRREGYAAALKSTSYSLFWFVCLGAHYAISLRALSGDAFLHSYWEWAFPPVGAAPLDTLRWLVTQLPQLADNPGGTTEAAGFWVIAIAGLAIGVRDGSRLAAMLATAAPSAFLLSALRLVPLSGRLSLWMLPSLYVGIAMAGNKSFRLALGPATRKAWPTTPVAVLCGVGVAWLCADIVLTGAMNASGRPRRAHGVDDRAAMRMLMALRGSGDAMLVTHLGLPAVYWYAGVNLATADQGSSLPDGGPIYEVWYSDAEQDCRPDPLQEALAGMNGVAMYLGFELGDHLEALVPKRLAEFGTIKAYRRFGERGHAAVIDLRQHSAGAVLPPSVQTIDPGILPTRCVTVKRARRW